MNVFIVYGWHEMTCPPKSDPVCILGLQGEKLWGKGNLPQNKS